MSLETGFTKNIDAVMFIMEIIYGRSRITINTIALSSITLPTPNFQDLVLSYVYILLFHLKEVQKMCRTPERLPRNKDSPKTKIIEIIT